MSTSNARFDQEDANGVIVLQLKPRSLDEQNAPDTARLWQPLVTNGVKLVLNFERVEYLSSIAIGKLLALEKALATIGGQVALCGLSQQITEVMDITKLNKFFKITITEGQAINAVFES